MPPEELVDRLAAHRLVGRAPREELRWLAAHGQLRRYEAGETVASPTSGPDDFGLIVVFSGRITIHVDRGAGRKKVMEWEAGDVTGLLPYSRATAPPGNTVAEEATDALMLHPDGFPDLIRECHELTSIFVHEMLDRARHFTTSDFHDEKMLSLGRLAAGLAHELNNPASAVARSASALPAYVAEADRAARALGAAGLPDAQLAAVDRFREGYAVEPAKRAHSPMEKADREDALARWLTDHSLDDTAAEALADSPVLLPELDRLAALLDRRTLDIAIRYVTADYAARTLTAEIERAASRISGLVAAVKRFTYLDQASVPKPVDVRQGLEDTLMVLNAKARAKAVTVTLDIAADLPSIQGFGGELNQVWANLIDNALDAVSQGGHVAVTATHHNHSIIVRVVDDGPGIPAGIRERIFDPFFTTKPVGEGTGLGLDIAQRLVRRHDGEIDVSAQPGHTEFRVTLPTSSKPRAPEVSSSGGPRE